MTSRFLAAVLAGGALLSVGPIAHAVPTPAATPIQPNPLAGQRKQVADAFAEVQKNRVALAKARSKVEATFSTKDEWVAAKKELDDAKAAYDAAVKPVLEKVRKNPEYKTAVADQLKAQKALDEAKAPASARDSDAITSEEDPSGSAPKVDAVKEAAALQLKAGLTKNRLETEAINDDPKVGEAKTRLEAARKAHEELETQVTEAVKTDPEYLQLTQQLEASEQQWVSAKQALAAAEKTQRDAEAAKQKAAAATASQGRSSSGSGGRGR